MSSDIAVKNETLRSRNASTFDGTWQTLGTPLDNPGFIIKFKNDTDKDVQVSYDGVNPHDIILEGDREVEDLNANRANTSEYNIRSAGTQVYVNASSGSGTFYLTVMYTS